MNIFFLAFIIFIEIYTHYIFIFNIAQLCINNLTKKI